MAKAAEDLRDTFLHSDEVLSTFPRLALPTPFPLSSGPIKLQERFVWGSFGSEMTPSVLVHLTLDW